MATSPENFSKVKNILQKLDQGIDAARSRRLTQSTRPATAQPQPVPATYSSPAAVPNVPNNNQPQPLRARPLMRPAEGF